VGPVGPCGVAAPVEELLWLLEEEGEAAAAPVELEEEEEASNLRNNGLRPASSSNLRPGPVLLAEVAAAPVEDAFAMVPLSPFGQKCLWKQLKNSCCASRLYWYACMTVLTNWLELMKTDGIRKT
jgi:hypothetical protein